MAKYIKIRKENVNIANAASDIIIGDIVSVTQGTLAGVGNANNVAIQTEGKTYLLTVTAAAADWTKDIQKALTANPGGVMAIVIPSSTVKVTVCLIA
jgi:hypothetical protein|tara:strand:- start:577 stop:867 length:291 start_codon:yes stop_codon:yes gene_type:complete